MTAYDLEAFELPPHRGAAPPAPPVALGPRQLAEAVRANRVLARQLGWGCVVGGELRPLREVNRILHRLGSPGPTGVPFSRENEESLAQDIARWQRTELHRRPNGQLDAGTWAEMIRRGALPPRRFEPRSWPVTFAGRRLGILEKTAPYERVQTAQVGGAVLQVAFRATDMDAVRRAGFVTATGEPFFRWIQVVEFIRRLDPPPSDVPPPVQHFIRRAGRQIDPTQRLNPPGAQDDHPYYWDEAPTRTFGRTFHIDNFRNRMAPNGLCYDLIFSDTPSVPIQQLAAELPGRRDYNNYELALVGVRPASSGRPTQNVILNTIRWGYDIVFEGGAPRVRLNSLQAGTQGGTRAMQALLGREIRRFPGHCFVGSGYPLAARCP
jgi:hypothetical protein